MNLIVAVDNNWGIGKGNQLLTRIPEDMRHFKEKTMGKIVVMGRKTFESLPDRKPLKERRNIVLSSSMEPTDGIEVAGNIENLMDIIKGKEESVFVIGGGCVYHQLMPYCNTAYVTKIKHSFDADVFMDSLDNEEGWEEREEGEEKEYNGMTYQFCRYTKQ